MANGEPKKGSLNKRQRRFVAEYLIDLNATQAAIRAGYSKHTAGSQGFDLLRKPEIQAAVGMKTQKQIEKVDISAEYVLKGLKEVGERCMTRVPVMVRGGRHLAQKTDANGEGVWEFDSAGANRALELLGKHLALFTEKYEVDVTSYTDLVAAAGKAPLSKTEPVESTEKGQAAPIGESVGVGVGVEPPDAPEGSQ